MDTTTGCTPVGPVGNPSTCVSPASTTAVYEPYDAGVANIDWRERYVVSDVHDQGRCGSCYAFSTIGAAESAYAIKTGELYDLSEQHVVDCDTVSYGCDGGWQKAASGYLSQDGTILDSEYPYIDGSQACKSTEVANRVFTLEGSGYSSVPKSKAAFKEAIRT